MSAEMQPPPESLMVPMNFPRKTLLGPGPSNASPRVLAASALPLLGHLHPEFTQIMDEVKGGIQYLFQTKNKHTLAISGTGHAAMEAACVNMLETGDVLLVACNGLWGERFSDMAGRNDIDVRKLVKSPGEVFSPAEIEEALKEHHPTVMFITHGESSGGTRQPLEDLGNLCHRYNCLLIVDSVAAAGGVPLFADKWGIDVIYSGSQKVLGAPPGASPISFSEAAWQKIQNRKTSVRSFYFDMNWLANYWNCNDEPRKYHHTAPISSMFALREALSALAEEGLEASWKRHQSNSTLLQDGLKELGLQMVVSDPSHRLPCVNNIVVPSGINWKQVADYAMQKYKVEISGGLGSLAGKIWRVGLMGTNSSADNVRLVLRAIKEGVKLASENPQAAL